MALDQHSDLLGEFIYAARCGEAGSFHTLDFMFMKTNSLFKAVLKYPSGFAQQLPQVINF